MDPKSLNQSDIIVIIGICIGVCLAGLLCTQLCTECNESIEGTTDYKYTYYNGRTSYRTEANICCVCKLIAGFALIGVFAYWPGVIYLLGISLDDFFEYKSILDNAGWDFNLILAAGIIVTC